MAKQKIYQVDAFTDKTFSGNPAAVCPFDQWPADELLQNIALENNLAETAFYVKKGDQYEIRWFTPAVEVDLCGHATLASAFVLFNQEGHNSDEILFHSPRSGELKVTRQGNLLTLNFPTDVYTRVELSHNLLNGFNLKPVLALKGKTDYVLVFDKEDQVRNIQPHLDIIAQLDARGVIVTAKGDEVDFVSRFFAPQSGINEDPVTGSAHTTLTPYWAKNLGKNELTAIQLSPRKGYLQCRYLGDRVEISGQGKLYLTGEIHLD
ncbi:PhzF family phenazine biosynthesis protein [Flavihumibacter solisilvae]|uniref:Isomerase n=1 Tax=Flavihumibacter solisilvae TaxID=1349421 RepID=A0A0C1L267_9BACT|nr:PhzF family phenazine biosynthesis protein [Flavihumibacter solisilvae]KIC94077.1 isomerase [Flavihumibacter solisilvae]